MIETGYILYIDAVCFTSDTEVNNMKIVKTSYKVHTNIDQLFVLRISEFNVCV